MSTVRCDHCEGYDDEADGLWNPDAGLPENPRLPRRFDFLCSRCVNALDCEHGFDPTESDDQARTMFALAEGRPTPGELARDARDEYGDTMAAERRLQERLSREGRA